MEVVAAMMQLPEGSLQEHPPVGAENQLSKGKSAQHMHTLSPTRTCAGCSSEPAPSKEP